VPFLVSLTRERVIYLALELDRSWRERTRRRPKTRPGEIERVVARDRRLNGTRLNYMPGRLDWRLAFGEFGKLSEAEVWELINGDAFGEDPITAEVTQLVAQYNIRSG